MISALAGRVAARHRPAVLLAGVVLAVAIDWLMIGGPRSAALGEARARLAALRIELAAARREAASRDETKRAVRDAARALRRAAARLPDQRELAALLAAVADDARAVRLELLSLRPKPERAAGDHIEVPVELELRGSFLEALAFLHRLEALGRLVRVGDVRVARPQRAGDRLLVEVRCTALTYRLPGVGPPATRAPGGEVRG